MDNAANVRKELYECENQVLDQNINWVLEWERKSKRKPRVLHIGNIANNAFNNAKLLNKAGFECDVLCADYYHIMGCPEWEDADFEGEVSDHFKPQWHEINLNGYTRPKWFVQGPRYVCLDYLIAKHSKKKTKAENLWRILSFANGTLEDSSHSYIKDFKIWAVAQWRRVLRAVFSPATLARYYSMAKGLLVKEIGGRFYRYFPERGPFAKKHPNIYSLFNRVCNYFSTGFLLILDIIIKPLLFLYQLLVNLVEEAVFRIYNRGPLKQRIQQRKFREDLTAEFRARFPSRKDGLRDKDIEPFQLDISIWKSVFSHYDIVLAYSTDPITPMLADVKYFALEHGTLRDIPFEDSPTGRLTALAYSNAEHAFVTNFDCLENAEKLCGDNHTFINHPFDEEHGLLVENVEELRESLCEELAADFLIFFPTRHDWVEGTGYADKANDRLISTFIRLRRNGAKLGMICCDWGKNVDQSRQLLRDESCAQFVSWHPPMGVMQFERTARASDITADQFKLGAFGGIAFKAMAVGAPVMSYLNPELLSGLYAEAPPILNCREPAEIEEILTRCMTDSSFLDHARAESLSWIKRYHSGQDTIIKQINQFRNILEA